MFLDYVGLETQNNINGILMENLIKIFWSVIQKLIVKGFIQHHFSKTLAIHMYIHV